MLLRRQRTGSVVCPSCHLLVGVNDEKCFHCGRPHPGMWGYASLLRGLGQDLGFVQLVTFSCALLYLATLLADPAGIRAGGFLSLLAPSGQSLYMFGASGALPVFAAGRWWTVLSAAWLHGGLLHIVFNMLWVRQLAPPTTAEYGVGRTVIIYTAASVSGFFLSSFFGLFSFLPGLLRGAPLTIGASAPIFGLLGALVYAGQRGSSRVSQQAWSLAAVLFLFGIMMPGIDNWAHAGGFAGGYLMGKWLNPLQPERTDHLIAALILIALTFLSIALSVMTA